MDIQPWAWTVSVSVSEELFQVLNGEQDRGLLPQCWGLRRSSEAIILPTLLVFNIWLWGWQQLMFKCFIYFSIWWWYGMLCLIPPYVSVLPNIRFRMFVLLCSQIYNYLQCSLKIRANAIQYCIDKHLVWIFYYSSIGFSFLFFLRFVEGLVRHIFLIPKLTNHPVSCPMGGYIIRINQQPDIKEQQWNNNLEVLPYKLQGVPQLIVHYSFACQGKF